VLAYDYSSRVALLDDPADEEMSPHLYPLCTVCAEGLRAPVGWALVDRRSKPPLFTPEPVPIGSARPERPPPLFGRAA
jgi:hypothetical protein